VVRQFAVRFPYIISKLAQKNLQKSYFKKCLSLRSIKKHQNPIKLNQSVRGPICSKISLYNPQIGPPQKTKPIYSNQYHKLVLILGIISLTSTQSKHSKDNILKKKSAAFFSSVCLYLHLDLQMRKKRIAVYTVLMKVVENSEKRVNVMMIVALRALAEQPYERSDHKENEVYPQNEVEEAMKEVKTKHTQNSAHYSTIHGTHLVFDFSVLIYLPFLRQAYRKKSKTNEVNKSHLKTGIVKSLLTVV
jgi:hypothetical protein